MELRQLSLVLVVVGEGPEVEVADLRDHLTHQVVVVTVVVQGILARLVLVPQTWDNLDLDTVVAEADGVLLGELILAITDLFQHLELVEKL